jgi:hypothetical protein
MIKRDIPRWLPFALLILVLIALFHRLLNGETLFWGLPTLQFYPWRQFAFTEIGAGRLPSWNPYVGAGAPLLANEQTAVFYPPNWLFLLLPDPQAMSWIAVLHVIWAGVGMWLFAGALGLPTFGRGISTLSYALSGYVIARLSSFPTADAVAWIPWVFWLVHRVILERKARDVGWLALAFAMQLLAGHAQTALYSSVGVGLYALWGAMSQQRRDPARVRIYGLAMIGVGMALGAAVAAVQIVPTAEYLRESQRSGGLDYKTLTNLSYHPLRLFTLFSPNFFGTPADGSYLAKGIYFEDAAYIGFIPMVSALAAVIGWFRKRKLPDEHPTFTSVPFWALLALVALIVAFGRYTPIFRVLYDHVPTFDAFREPVRWLVLTVFSLSVLAGIGTGHWGRGKWVVFWSRLAAAGGGALVIMALVALHVMHLDSENLRVLAEGMLVLGCWITVAGLLTLTQPLDPAISPSPLSPLLWRVTVLIVVALDLAWMANGLNPTVPTEIFDIHKDTSVAGRTYWFDQYQHDVTFGSEESEDELAAQGKQLIVGYFDVTDYRIATQNWRALRASGLPNINMLDRVPSLSNNDPLLPSGYSQYIDMIEELGAGAGPLLQAANVTQVYGTVPDGWQGENPAVAPYVDEVTSAWLVPETLWLDSDDAIQAALRDPDWDPMQTVTLSGGDENTSATSGGGTVTLIESSPTERRYQVKADSAEYLVIAETWYPGWTVTVNGQTGELYRANLTFQAVAVPAGENEVTLHYTPNHWKSGVFITTLSLLIALALIVAARLKRLSGGEVWTSHSSR